MKRPPIHLLILLLIVGSFLPGVSFAERRTASQELRIGVILGLAGPAQQWAKFARMGAELAAKEAQAESGSGALKLIIEDSHTTAADTVTAYRKLRTVDRIDALIGDVWSFLTLPLIPLTDRDALIHIAPTVVPESVPAPGKHFFTLSQSPGASDGAIERFFEIHPEVKTVSLFCWDDPWGDAYRAVWTKVIERRGIQVLDVISTHDFNYDYRTDVLKVAAKKPDAVFVSYHMDRLFRQFAERKFSPKILATNNLVDPLSGGTLPWELAAGVYFTDARPSPAFIERFQAQYHEAPILEAQSSYEAVRAIIAAQRANAADLTAGLKTVHYEGVAGPVDFRSSFAANKAHAGLFKIQGNSIVPAE